MLNKFVARMKTKSHTPRRNYLMKKSTLYMGSACICVRACVFLTNFEF